MSQGIEQLRFEMKRQHEDALSSLRFARLHAEEIATPIKQKGRLALLGMGGSHWVNRAACAYYRYAGIDATAHVVSEYMRAPLPGDPALLITSQSGRSGEVLRLFEMGLSGGAAAGLTLEGDSPLATTLPCLVGVGGKELAYAATRSQMITLAQHAAILECLGADISDVLAALRAGPISAEIEAAVELLSRSDVAVTVARGSSAQGIMDAVALCLMETARMPVLGLEAGQFRHGPFEMVNEDSTAVLMLRGAGPDSDDLEGLAMECVSFGMTPIIVDASGRPAVPGCITVNLPAKAGLGLLFTALPVLQDIVVSASERRIPDAGIPHRSSKVASAEVA